VHEWGERGFLFPDAYGTTKLYIFRARIQSVLWIRIGFIADPEPDPAFLGQCRSGSTSRSEARGFMTKSEKILHLITKSTVYINK
jgi:hypothetical protein